MQRCSTEMVRAAAERLNALVERELVFPAEARFVDEAAYRFRHVLVRDAAYAAIVKHLRAELHEHFADWLERKVGDRLSEVEEIVGYHIEQAYRYREELGPVDDRARALAGAGGGAPLTRPAAVLKNAARHPGGCKPPATRRRPHIRGRARPCGAPSSAWAPFISATSEFDRVDAAFTEAQRLAAESGDRRMEVFARLDRAQYHRMETPWGAARSC